MSVLHADVVVIGNELCGSAAAALLALTRHKVVVIDDEDEGDARALGGVLLPTAPCLWRLPKKGPAVEIIDALGLRQDARRLLQEPVGIGIVDDPDVRMALPLDDKEREKELIRVFGDASAADAFNAISYDVAVRYLSEATRLHEDGFIAKRKEKRRLKEILDAHDDDPATIEVQAFTRGLKDEGLAQAFPFLAPFLQNHASPRSQGVGGLLALARFHRGTLGDCDVGLGAREELRGLFRKVIEGHGGEVLLQTKVSELRVSGKKITHVGVGNNEYATKTIIDAGRGRSLPDHLPQSRIGDKERRLRDAVKSTKNGVVVRWLLPKDALPAGVEKRMLLLPREGMNDVSMVVSLHYQPPKLSSPTQHKIQRNDQVVGVVAAARATNEPSHEVVDKMEARLEALFPFAKKERIAQDTLLDDDAAIHFPAYEAEDGGTHVLAGRRPRGAFANIARAGRDLVPLFGLGGELAAARSVTSLVEDLLKK
ncbi:MAG: hypothetical protein GY822_24020 [Deltaproteobacteria bacterium]|nr:hypothetical protein [Deltaproteobacteria bacterium]